MYTSGMNNYCSNNYFSSSQETTSMSSFDSKSLFVDSSSYCSADREVCVCVSLISKKSKDVVVVHQQGNSSHTRHNIF